LWSIIVETNVTAIHGAGPAMRELEIVTLKSKLNTMRQKPNMTIGEFKKVIDDNLEVITGAGVELGARVGTSNNVPDQVRPNLIRVNDSAAH
jgi:hypothetical protein